MDPQINATLLAALKQLAERVNDVTRNGYGAGMFEPEMAEARSAIRKAETGTLRYAVVNP